jgi:hypothetical protein
LPPVPLSKIPVILKVFSSFLVRCGRKNGEIF